MLGGDLKGMKDQCGDVCYIERGADEIEVPDLDTGYSNARFVIVTMLFVPEIL